MGYTAREAPDRLDRHGCTDDVVPVESVVTGEVLAHLCTGCGETVLPCFYPRPPIPDGHPRPARRLAWWCNVPAEPAPPPPTVGWRRAALYTALALLVVSTVTGSLTLTYVCGGVIGGLWGAAHYLRTAPSTGDLGPS